MVLVRGVGYWLLSWIQYPLELLSVRALYQEGDLRYFPLIRAFAEGQWGEFALWESIGREPIGRSVASAVPWGAIALHGLFYKWFGLWGLPIADTLVSGLYFGLLILVLRTLHCSRRLAIVTALLLGSDGLNHGLGAFNQMLGRWTSQVMPLQLWGWTFPVPFVSDLFLLSVILFAGRLFVQVSGMRRMGNWIGLGLSIAALIQSDFPEAVIALCALVGLLILRLLRSPDWRSVWRGLLGFGVSATLLLLPFWIQRGWDTPETWARWGLLPIDRWPNLAILPGWEAYGLLLLFLGWGWGLRLHYRARQLAGQFEGYKLLQNLTFWSTWAIAAYVALPLASLISGKTIPTDPFLDRAGRIVLFAFILLTAYTWKALQPQIQRVLASGFGLGQGFGRGQGWVSRSLMAIACVLAIGFTAYDAQQIANHRGHEAVDRSNAMQDGQYREEQYREEQYRSNFAALTQELEKPEYKTRTVMGTWDVQPYVWWITFQNGRSFLPPAAFTTLDDAAIATRLQQFCQILELSSAQCVEQLQLPTTQPFWVPPQFNVTKLQLDLKDERALPRLDLIVLDRSQPGQPNLDRYVKTYENSIFQVWVLR